MHEKDGTHAVTKVSRKMACRGFCQCELCVKQESPHLAASPDGMFFYCDCCIALTLNVKCPLVLCEEGH